MRHKSHWEPIKSYKKCHINTKKISNKCAVFKSLNVLWYMSRGGGGGGARRWTYALNEDTQYKYKFTLILWPVWAWRAVIIQVWQHPWAALYIPSSSPRRAPHSSCRLSDLWWTCTHTPFSPSSPHTPSTTTSITSTPPLSLQACWQMQRAATSLVSELQEPRVHQEGIYGSELIQINSSSNFISHRQCKQWSK